jgi:hypothetical protein
MKTMTGSRSRTRATHVIALLLLAFWPAGEASAQGIFDFLFGTPPQRRAPTPMPSGPSTLGPSQPSGPTGQMPPPPGNVGQAIGNSGTGRVAAYCVRLCDGRYFPLERHATATPTQLCSAFCPSTPTKVYNGAEISYAVASDNTRYGDLKTAYLYRKTLLKDCTCNGKDPYGLATIDVKTDPTLRAGDTVATADGVTTVARPGRPSDPGPVLPPTTR